jgi:hypothetical protein
VSFGTTGISTPLPTPNTIDILEKEFNHDICRMVFWGGDVNSDDLASGSPISIQWGRSPVMRNFYGYVNHASRVNNALVTSGSLTDRNAVEVVAVGASWPMKAPGTGNWGHNTVSQVVQIIADQFGFTTNITSHPTVWPSLQMAGKSYWQFCVKLAKMVGYTFYCSGTELVFKPRTTDPHQLASLAAVYDMQKNPMGMFIFNPTVGAANPEGGQLYNRQVYGIDAKTTQIIFSQVSGSPSNTKLGSTVNVPSFNKTEHFNVRSQHEADTLTKGCGLLN